MRSESGFVRRLGKSLLGSLHACNYWSIDLPSLMVRLRRRSYRLSRICFRGENFIPQGYNGHRARRILQTKSPRLAAGEPGVWPLVQFFQVRQRIDGQLMRVVLSG